MNNDLELLNESFKSLDQDELNSIDGGFDWRDVAMAGGAMLGGALTGGNVIGGAVGGIIGGAIYDFLT